MAFTLYFLTYKHESLKGNNCQEQEPNVSHPPPLASRDISAFSTAEEQEEQEEGQEEQE